VPQTARGIIDRIDEISFNSTFMLELGAIAFVEHLIKSTAVKAAPRLLNVHGIGDEALGSFGASSKMNNDWGFLQHLQEIGWRAVIIGSRRTSPRSGTVPRSTLRASFRRRMAPSRYQLS
jgi:NTE family protein